MKKVWRKIISILLIIVIMMSTDSIYVWAHTVSENMPEECGNVEEDTLSGMFMEEESSGISMPLERNGVALGVRQSAVITQDGNLYTWGYNDSGELGDGTNMDNHIPVKTMSNISKVALGSGAFGRNHGAAIMDDGSLYMWGWNEDGRLGNGTGSGYFVTPIKIMDDVVSCSLGSEHSAAITKDGSLYTWGRNFRGALGNGTTISSFVPIKIMDDVIFVSLGFSCSAAITEDGSLYTWGDNCLGTLGNGTTTDSSVPIKIMDDVVSVSMGFSCSAAITKNGDLYMWGHNDYGQLGNGTTIKSTVPIKIMNNVSLVSVSNLHNHSAAVTKDGNLYMWGRNDYGQLGNGTTVDSAIPIKIMDNVSAISLGGLYSGAVTKDGSLYMWGRNDYGQLGNGTTIDSHTPVKILDNIYTSEDTTETVTGKYVVGKLSSVDSLTSEIAVDNVTYSVSDNFKMNDAASILRNSETKQVICTMDRGKVTKMEAIENIVEPKLALACDGENITYQNWEYVKNSQDIQVLLMCGVKAPYTLADVAGVEGIGIDVGTIESTLPENTLNFGISGFINKKPVLEKKETVGRKLMLGETVSYDYTVYVSDAYEMPAQVRPEVNISISATIDGNEQKWEKPIVFSNLDYQRQKAEEQKREREARSDISKAKKELEKLCNSNYLTLGTDLNLYLDKSQIQAIEKYLYVWVAEVNNAQTYTENKDINKKIMEKLGINPYVGYFYSYTQASTRVMVKTKYGEKTIEFTFNCGTLNSNGNSYASFGDISYDILDKSGIPKGMKTKGKCAVSTYAGMDNFIDCMQNVAEDSVKKAYQEIWGNNANYIAGLVVDETIMSIIEQKYGSFSNGVYTLITEPTKNTIKKGRVDCPVDVYIYDMDGKLCGSIVDNVVDSNNAEVSMYLEGDSKVFYLTGDDYEVRLVGNDTGTMDYSVQELNEDMQILRTISFQNLALTRGKEYEGKIYEPLYIDKVLYSLESDNSLVPPDKDTYQGAAEQKIFVTGIELDNDKIELTLGDSVQLYAKVTPNNASNQKVTWKSSNEAVAVVDSAGKVTAKSAGTINVSAVSDDGFFEKTCVIVVGEAEEIPSGPDTWKSKTGIEGFVYRLYNIALSRDAEEAGLADWTNRLKTKKENAAQVAWGIFFSKEFQNKNYTDAQYIEMLYKTMFGRDSDNEGKKYWLECLDNGVSREYVYRGFAESAEFSNLCSSFGVERGFVTLGQYRDRNMQATGFIARLYTKMLGRKFDEDGLEYWCEKYLTRENTIEEIASHGFLHSEELANLNLSDEEFVIRMYETFLNREPEEDGLNDWIGRLERGEVTRDTLVYGFTHSQEFGNLKAEYNLP